jgi:hypothetical protein
MIYTGRSNLSRTFDSATDRVSDCRISQIANCLEPFDVPLKRLESYLPIWYSGLPEFQPIRDPKVKIRLAAVLSKDEIQQ